MWQIRQWEISSSSTNFEGEVLSSQHNGDIPLSTKVIIKPKSLNFEVAAIISNCAKLEANQPSLTIMPSSRNANHLLRDTIQEYQESCPNITVHFGIPNIYDMSLTEHQKLLIFDDMAETCMNDPSIRDLSTFTSRKGSFDFSLPQLLFCTIFFKRILATAAAFQSRAKNNQNTLANISAIIISQNLYAPSKFGLTIRRNFNYFLFFFEFWRCKQYCKSWAHIFQRSYPSRSL